MAVHHSRPRIRKRPRYFLDFASAGPSNNEVYHSQLFQFSRRNRARPRHNNLIKIRGKLTARNPLADRKKLFPFHQSSRSKLPTEQMAQLLDFLVRWKNDVSGRRAACRPGEYDYGRYIKFPSNNGRAVAGAIRRGAEKVSNMVTLGERHLRNEGDVAKLKRRVIRGV